MFTGLRRGVALAASVAVLAAAGAYVGLAQEPGGTETKAPPAGAPQEPGGTEPETKAPPAAVALEVKQLKLTEAHIKGFIAAQKDLLAMAEKLEKAGDNPDEALKAELDALAKKHGFADFAELDNVANSIAVVMGGLDPKTGGFNDPREDYRKQLEEIKADASIPETEKTQLVEELNEAIKTTPTLEHKENIEVVKAHLAEIEQVLQ